MRRSKLPKCPKCKGSYGLTLSDKQAHCSYCQHTWKPTTGVSEKIAAQAEYEAGMRQAKASRIDRDRLAAEAAKAAYAQRWRRAASGGADRDAGLDLAPPPADDVPAPGDRLTEHLDGLAEAGFVDGSSSPRHSDYCYVLNGLELTTCDPHCPLIAARQQAYLVTAHRNHPDQLSLFST